MNTFIFSLFVFRVTCEAIGLNIDVFSAFSACSSAGPAAICGSQRARGWLFFITQSVIVSVCLCGSVANYFFLEVV